MAERQRHIDELGFDANWLQHQMCLSLVQNARYLLGGDVPYKGKVMIKRLPEDGTYHREDLLAAGALIAAAVERLDQVNWKWGKV